MRTTAAALVITLLATPAVAQQATVTDGDTIKVAGAIFRLHGIDAPETRQLCLDGWPAGKMATEFMINLVAGHNVTCVPETKDRYGRTVAKCLADGVDIQASMVRAGMALAFVRYSQDYVAEEAQAKSLRLGVHLHNCQAPWAWRAEQKADRLQTQKSPPQP